MADVVKPAPTQTAEHEVQRLLTLSQYMVVDTPPEATFDHIVQLAANAFDTPMALLSFVEKDRQFFKARIGLDISDTLRDISFCAHILGCDDDVMVVPDACRDVRFKDNPLVTAEPYIRFYAGAPLINADGYKLGSICVIDTQPRGPLARHEKTMLLSIARLIMDHLETRRQSILTRSFSRMAAAMPDAIVYLDENGTIAFWNEAAERMFGYPRREAIGKSLDMIVPGFRAALRAKREAVQAGSDLFSDGRTVEVTGVRRDRSQFPAELSLTFWREGERAHFGGIIRDVSQRHRAQEQLRYITHFDCLTGLPNRTQLVETIELDLARAAVFSLLKIGLDGFKAINASLGMTAGDIVLKETAERILDAAGSEAFVARLGADEFGVLLRQSADPELAKAVCENIIPAFSKPFYVHGSACHLGASIGVVSCFENSRFDDANAVLKSGLLALHEAKKEGGRRYKFFRQELLQEAEERRKLDEELRLAFARGEFELHFQPQVRLDSRRIVGAEALLRWRHPERGLLAPSSFLVALENSDIAMDVGRWIINTACAFAADLTAAGTPIRMGLNLFAVQLRDETLYSAISVALATHYLPPHLLELEITETTVLGFDENIVDPLRQLRKLGVGIAFDDYGTGFGSLSLLKRYPLTRLKIDVEFVRGLLTNPDDAAIVKAVLALGRSMGFHVTAEGVETEDQAAKLLSLRCEEVQGFLFGKAMPASQFRAHFAREAPEAAA